MKGKYTLTVSLPHHDGQPSLHGDGNRPASRHFHVIRLRMKTHREPQMSFTSYIFTCQDMCSPGELQANAYTVSTCTTLVQSDPPMVAPPPPTCMNTRLCGECVHADSARVHYPRRTAEAETTGLTTFQFGIGYLKESTYCPSSRLPTSKPSKTWFLTFLLSLSQYSS